MIKKLSLTIFEKIMKNKIIKINLLENAKKKRIDKVKISLFFNYSFLLKWNNNLIQFLIFNMILNIFYY